MNSTDFRRRVLRGLAANRTPGFHFAGNFLGVSYDRVASDGARISLEAGPHCIDSRGEMDLGAVAMLADIALATSIRCAIDSDRARLATVSMHLQFTGAAITGKLEAFGEFQGFLAGTAARQGVSRVALDANGTRVGFGSGAFMALEPPAGVTMHPVVPERPREAAPLDESRLEPGEAAILRHADEVLARIKSTSSLIEAFWGFEAHRTESGGAATLKNGGHVSNRVGHVQGGLLVGLSAKTAMAALPATWMLASVSACFVSPGEGESLHASSKVIHHGRDTAVVRTEVTGVDGRKVLQTMSTHARRPATA